MGPLHSRLPRSDASLARLSGAAPQTQGRWRLPATEARSRRPRRRPRRSWSRFFPSGSTSARRRTPSLTARSPLTSPPSSLRLVLLGATNLWGILYTVATKYPTNALVHRPDLIKYILSEKIKKLCTTGCCSDVSFYLGP